MAKIRQVMIARPFLLQLLLLLWVTSYQATVVAVSATASAADPPHRKPKSAHDIHLQLKQNKKPTSNSKSSAYNPKHHTTSISESNNNVVEEEEERKLLRVQPRVVGGNVVTDLNKHPFFAEWHGQYCGGALIHDDLVITAAHCDNAGDIATSIYFRNVERRQQGSVIRTIVDRVAHPQFNAEFSTRDYDYLILKLDTSALVDGSGNPTGVEAIKINDDPNIPRNGDALWGIGYGQVGEDIGGMSTKLREAEIFAFDNQRCENQYWEYFEEDYMFCSGVDGGGVDTCQGDSGGPIVHQGSETLVGIVSFGIGCARPSYAGVNSRISAAADWIERAMCEFSDYAYCDGAYTDIAAEPPAPEPEPVTDNNNIPGSVTITVTMDDYPEETSWTLIAEGAQSAMYFLPAGDFSIPRQSDQRTFTDLTQGVNYLFKISDSEADGVCCSYGQGSVTIRDNVKGLDLWTSRGNFGAYYEVDFDIKPNGHARLKGQSTHYKPSTWTDFEDVSAPLNEPSWPGAMPDVNVSSIVVNVDTDDYPEENTWELHRKVDSQAANNAASNAANIDPWVPVADWSGVNAGFRNLVSTEINNLQEGWHRFVVRDSEGDGNCCGYGAGYVTLTGPLASKAGELGLIWGNDGQFWGRDEIYFYVDSSGLVSHITYTEATTTAISRTMENPDAP